MHDMNIYLDPSWSRNFAEWQKKEMGQRVSRGMRLKAEQGIMPGCAPLGYKNAVIDGKKTIAIDPENAPKVKKLFDRAAKKMSLRKLAIESEKMGLRSRNGKPFGPSSIKALLDNPYYCGLIRYKGEIIPGEQEPLVPQNVKC